MSFLMPGRSPWWRHDQNRPPASEPAPEPVTQDTGLPVTAPAPAGATDDLSLAARFNRDSAQRLDERHRTETARCNCCNGTPANRQMADAELRLLESLADLTRRHGPWEAAQRMWTPTLRGQR